MKDSTNNPRFVVLTDNALGVRDIHDDNNIHLGSRIEAVEVAVMLNVFHDRAVECKQMVATQAQRILELTEELTLERDAMGMLQDRAVIAQQETVKAEAMALTAIAANRRKDSEIIAEEHY